MPGIYVEQKVLRSSLLYSNNHGVMFYTYISGMYEKQNVLGRVFVALCYGVMQCSDCTFQFQI